MSTFDRQKQTGDSEQGQEQNTPLEDEKQMPLAPKKPENKKDPASVVKTSGRKPGEYSPPMGQESGSDWQESQQMGQTGHGGVQEP